MRNLWKNIYSVDLTISLAASVAERPGGLVSVFPHGPCRSVLTALTIPAMNSPKLNDKNDRCSSSMSTSNSRKLSECKDDSLENSSRSSECLKTDRVSTKGEEDSKRRTIIIEKKSGSYGFTLQSYGIHYRKEREVEMITYVEAVTAGGAAARAGLRPGDVILAVDGADVAHADHAALVRAIAECGARMRIVVSFEDCVQKVELHVKYINLQKVLQIKMRELEQLSLREYQLLNGKWKTHSLPSQKKKASSPESITYDEDLQDIDDMSKSYERPTSSTENVTKQKKQTISFMYQYMDPQYGAYVIQPDIRNGSFVVSVGSPRNRQDYQHFIIKQPSDVPSIHNVQIQAHGLTQNNLHIMKKHGQNHNHIEHQNHVHVQNHAQTQNHNQTQSNVQEYRNVSSTASQTNRGHKKTSSGRRSCTPCVTPAPGQNPDSSSLEAYDLASPCCDPNCVPNARRRSRKQKECSKEHKKREKASLAERENNKTDCYTQTKKEKICQATHCSSRYKYLHSESAVNSTGCSVVSCNNSHASAAANSCKNSTSSYSTSLSSDTLFWEMDRQDSKSSPKQVNSQHQYPPEYYPNCKPKSWDNLTTKGFGGYGFGYGYLDTAEKQPSRSKSHSRNHSSRSHHSSHSYHSHHSETGERHNGHRQSASLQYTNAHCFPPTKSTESLLVISKYQIDPGVSERQLCECLDGSSHSGGGGYYHRRSTHAPATTARSPVDHVSSGYYSQHILYPSNQSHKKKDNLINSEITRL